MVGVWFHHTYIKLTLTIQRIYDIINSIHLSWGIGGKAINLLWSKVKLKVFKTRCNYYTSRITSWPLSTWVSWSTYYHYYLSSPRWNQASITRKKNTKTEKVTIDLVYCLLIYAIYGWNISRIFKNKSVITDVARFIKYFIIKLIHLYRG